MSRLKLLLQGAAAPHSVLENQVSSKVLFLLFPTPGPCSPPVMLAKSWTKTTPAACCGPNWAKWMAKAVPGYTMVYLNSSVLAFLADSYRSGSFQLFALQDPFAEHGTSQENERTWKIYIRASSSRILSPTLTPHLAICRAPTLLAMHPNSFRIAASRKHWEAATVRWQACRRFGKCLSTALSKAWSIIANCSCPGLGVRSIQND